VYVTPASVTVEYCGKPCEPPSSARLLLGLA
jgi:hypothetical protein